jgi:peroxiredoxin
MSYLKPLLLCAAALVFAVPSVAQQTAPPTTTAVSLKPPAANAREVNPILVSSKVPAVTVSDIAGKPVALVQKVTEKPTILIFYRGGWCPYCNKQMSQLQEIEPQLTALGYQVLALSPDKPEELQKSAAKSKLTYTLLSDSDAQAMRAFGIAYRVDDDTVKKYKDSYKIDFEAYTGRDHHLLPAPAVFVVGTNGVIQFSYVNPDYSVRLSPEVLLAAAKAALPTTKPTR